MHQVDKKIKKKKNKGCKDMSLSQMKHEAKYQISFQEYGVFDINLPHALNVYGV